MDDIEDKHKRYNIGAARSVAPARHRRLSVPELLFTKLMGGLPRPGVANEFLSQPSNWTGLQEAYAAQPKHETEASGLKHMAQLVRSAREASGKSQADFAALAGVGRRFLSELENGKPTLEIGKVLQVLSAAGIDLYVRKR
jgi:y4mF family transcriptional regulator